MKIKNTQPMDVVLYKNRPVIVASIEETEVIVAFVKPASVGHTYGTESIKPDAEVQMIFHDGWASGVLTSDEPAPESAQEPADCDNPFIPLTMADVNATLEGLK